VGAHSEGPGKGSEFTVWLPTVRRQGSDVPSPEVEEVRSEIRRRVLIVEDNADARESLGMLLEMQGHDVRSAQDGDTALKIVEEFLPEVVLLDIGLPKMDGFEVIRRLHVPMDGAQPAVIAVTGYGHAEDRRRTERSDGDRGLLWEYFTRSIHVEQRTGNDAFSDVVCLMYAPIPPTHTHFTADMPSYPSCGRSLCCCYSRTQADP
jgi:CheY-like chemotaxis protein